ncbi:MAG: glycosyltransferase family 1 protein, partial [Patescibacteria group bacterium]
MRIGIDARFWASTKQGIDRYTGEIIMHLAKLDRENTYFIFIRTDAKISELADNFHPVRVPYRWYGFSEQTAWPFFLRRFNLDLMHFTHFNVPLLYRRPFVVTIHDLILLQSQGTHLSTRNPAYFFVKFVAYKAALSSALKRARKIITVSKYSRNDIVRHYPHTSGKVTVIYNGITSCAGTNDVNYRDLRLPKKYALYVGNAYPHKNLDFLLQQFSMWVHENPGTELVLIGKRDAFYSALEIRYPAMDYKYIHFWGMVDDSTLAAAYRAAQLFIMPSVHEGFGMPVLEAMSAGIPVLAARAGATPEIAGDAALYFKPGDCDDFRDKLSTVSSDMKMLDTLR